MLKKTIYSWILLLISLLLAVTSIVYFFKGAKGFLFLLLVVALTLVIYFFLRSVFQPRSLNDKASKLKYRQ